jgi:hypothetical protein
MISSATIPNSFLPHQSKKESKDMQNIAHLATLGPELREMGNFGKSEWFKKCLVESRRFLLSAVILAIYDRI